MRIRTGTLWILATAIIMAVLIVRFAAGGADTSPAAPSAQDSHAEAEVAALLGNLAGDPAISARTIEFADDSSANIPGTSEAFEDLGRSGAIVLLSALTIASGLIGAIWLKGRLVY